MAAHDDPTRISSANKYSQVKSNDSDRVLFPLPQQYNNNYSNNNKTYNSNFNNEMQINKSTSSNVLNLNAAADEILASKLSINIKEEKHLFSLSNNNAGSISTNTSVESVSNNNNNYHSNLTSSPNSANSYSINAKIESLEMAIEQRSSSFEVDCVYFARGEEVEMLWLETCKVFSDLCNDPVEGTFLNAAYCLEV
jgi:hypothetical protein